MKKQKKETKRSKFTRCKSDFEDWLIKLVRTKKLHCTKESSAFKVYVKIIPTKNKYKTITGWEYLDLDDKDLQLALIHEDKDLAIMLD